MDEETLEIRVEFDGSQALTLLMILKTGFDSGGRLFCNFLTSTITRHPVIRL